MLRYPGPMSLRFLAEALSFGVRQCSLQNLAESFLIRGAERGDRRRGFHESRLEPLAHALAGRREEDPLDATVLCVGAPFRQAALLEAIDRPGGVRRVARKLVGDPAHRDSFARNDRESVCQRTGQLEFAVRLSHVALLRAQEPHERAPRSTPIT